MASSYGLHTVTSAETAFNKLTVSCWLKGRADGTQRNFWGIYDNTSSGRFFGLYYSTNGSLYGYWKQNEGTFFTLGTTQKFRDPSAWFHFQMTMDTTLSTAADRVKFYVNGERVTSFEDSLDTASPFTQNATCNILSNTDGRMQWGGGKISGTQYYWDGLMSHCHMCVGYAYDASEFGETDSTTGQWKIKTSPSVSYGTNGGWWFKDGSQLTDSSTNSNTLTSSGTLTNTEDCPSNVFATLNPLWQPNSVNTFSNGNTTHTVSGSFRTACTTLGATSGKFYAEYKATDVTNFCAGIVPLHGDLLATNQNLLGDSGNGWAIINNFGTVTYRNSGSNTSTSHSFSDGDIVMIAMDLDNDKVFFGKNGTWLDSGDPANGTNPAFSNVSDVDAIGFGSSPENANGSWNFGNGYFGTTAISSEGTNASGIGKFEYDVPTGYTALSTKGLNE